MFDKLIFILLLTFCTTTFAQNVIESKEGKYLKLTFPTKSNFVNSHILSIHYGFDADTMSQVIVNPVEDETYMDREFLKGSMKQRFKYFDLSFEGDRLVFKKNYSSIEVPLTPRLQFLDKRGKLSPECSYKLISIGVFKDSSVFFFSADSLPEPMFWGQPAKFKGELRLLETQISQKLADLNVKRNPDSIIVFRATVIAGESRNQDKLQMDELIYGKETYFSDIVRKVLNDTNNKSSMPGHSNWAAATNASARPQTTRIKIFAWLKPNGQVELKLPSKLQNWTGD